MAAEDNLHEQQFERHLPGQEQLFNPASTRARTPGEMTPEAWHQRSDVSYHGTFNPHWESAPYVHFGDVKAATQRLEFVGRLIKENPTARLAYYSGEQAPEEGYEGWEGLEEPETHTGQVHARRLDLATQRKPLSDPIINAAQQHAMLNEGYESWEIPTSIAQSSAGLVSRPDWEQPVKVTGSESERRQVKAGSRLLRMGKGLAYQNVGEPGETGVSHVAPRGARTSWEVDVVTDPHASTMSKQFAKHRLTTPEAGTVPFPLAGTRPQPTLTGGQRQVPDVSHVSKIQFQTED